MPRPGNWDMWVSFANFYRANKRCLRMKAEFIVIILAMAILCASGVAQEDSSETWYKKSQELYKNGSYEESIETIDRAIELNPGNATLWDAKASSLGRVVFFTPNFNKYEYSEALQAQDKAIELDPEDSILRMHKGFLLANLADVSGHKNKSLYGEAIREFDKAIELDPQNKVAWIFKGSVLDTRLNRSEEALAAYDKAIETGSTNVQDNVWLANAWMAKGGALAKLGMDNESFEAFDEAIDLDPQNATFVWYEVAEVLNASGRYDEAIKAYDKVINLDPKSTKGFAAQAHEGKGIALFNLNKYDESIEAYDRAIELYPFEPMSGRTWYRKGIALKALGRNSEANAVFEKAKELGYEG